MRWVPCFVQTFPHSWHLARFQPVTVSNAKVKAPACSSAPCRCCQSQGGLLGPSINYLLNVYEALGTRRGPDPCLIRVL